MFWTIIKAAHRPLSRGRLYDSFLVFLARIGLLVIAAIVWVLCLGIGMIAGII
jgi:hypothetical protein